MAVRIGMCGLDSSHAEDFLRYFNREERHAGIRVTALWDSAASRVKELTAFSPEARPVRSIAELVDAVDAVIVGDRQGDLHLANALPFLGAGRPVFVDKPLANSMADAAAIVTAAERTGTPLLSGSALRWQAETKALKARLVGQSGPFGVTAYGTWYPESEYGGAIFYAIHTIEMMQELIGTQWSDVRVERGENTTVRFRCGAVSATLAFKPLGPSGSSAFGFSVETPNARIEQPVPLRDDYMAPVAAEFARMLETGISPMSRQELLAPIALMAEIERLLREPI